MGNRNSKLTINQTKNTNTSEIRPRRKTMPLTKKGRKGPRCIKATSTKIRYKSWPTSSYSKNIIQHKRRGQESEFEETTVEEAPNSQRLGSSSPGPSQPPSITATPQQSEPSPQPSPQPSPKPPPRPYTDTPIRAPGDRPNNDPDSKVTNPPKRAEDNAPNQLNTMSQPILQTTTEQQFHQQNEHIKRLLVATTSLILEKAQDNHIETRNLLVNLCTEISRKSSEDHDQLTKEIISNQDKLMNNLAIVQQQIYHLKQRRNELHNDSIRSQQEEKHPGTQEPNNRPKQHKARKPVICYRCGEENHYAVNCLTKYQDRNGNQGQPPHTPEQNGTTKRRERTNESGIKTQYRTSWDRAQQPKKAEKVYTIETHHVNNDDEANYDSHLRIQATIGNTRKQTLIDSGASINCLRPDIFKQIQKDCPIITLDKEHNIQAHGAGGQKINISGKAVIHTKIGSGTYKVEYHIMDITEEAILGRDFIHKQEIIINNRSRTLLIGDESIHLLTNKQTNKINKQKPAQHNPTRGTCNHSKSNQEKHTITPPHEAHKKQQFFPNPKRSN